MEQELTDYIVQAQKHGLSDFEIKQNLLNVGWEASVVEQNFAFARAAENKASFSGEQHPQPKRSTASPVEQFQHPQQASPNLAATQFPVHSPITVSESSFQNPADTGKPFYKKLAFWLVLIFLFISTGGAYGYYAYFYATPQIVWDKYLSAKQTQTYKSNYSLSYSFKDGGEASGTESSYGISGEAYNNLSDLNNLQLSNSISVSAKTASGAGYNGSFQYLLIDKVLYLNINAVLSPLNLANQIPSGWVKVDFEALQKFLKDNQSANFSKYEKSINSSDESHAKLKEIWSAAKIITPTEFLAREKINGISVYHIKNSFDSRELATAIIASLEAASDSSTSTPIKLTAEQKTFAVELIQKFRIKDFDVWIGQRDSQLYKIHLTVLAPSPADFSNSGLADSSLFGQSKAKSRDAKRLADIRQADTALALYFNDNGGYPPVANGVPLLGTDPQLAGINLASLPPKPEDGTCTNYFNTYWYTPEGKFHLQNGIEVFPSYKMTFCLGADTGGYAAGIGKLTPNGIEAGIVCPGPAEKCVNTNPKPAVDIKQAMDLLNSTGQINFDNTFSDLGKSQALTAPPQSTDILDLLQSVLPPSSASTTPF
jgi:hypothetical protein